MANRTPTAFLARNKLFLNFSKPGEIIFLFYQAMTSRYRELIVKCDPLWARFGPAFGFSSRPSLDALWRPFGEGWPSGQAPNAEAP